MEDRRRSDDWRGGMEGGRQMGVSRMNLGRGNREDQVKSKCTTLCQRSVNKTFLQDISDEGESTKAKTLQ